MIIFPLNRTGERPNRSSSMSPAVQAHLVQFQYDAVERGLNALNRKYTFMKLSPALQQEVVTEVANQITAATAKQIDDIWKNGVEVGI